MAVAFAAPDSVRRDTVGIDRCGGPAAAGLCGDRLRRHEAHHQAERGARRASSRRGSCAEPKSTVRDAFRHGGSAAAGGRGAAAFAAAPPPTSGAADKGRRNPIDPAGTCTAAGIRSSTRG